MKKWNALVLMLACSLLSTGQNFGEIKGRLVDAITGESVPFAAVGVDGGGTVIGGVSDENGRFRIKPLSPGTYDVNVPASTYQKATVSNVEVRVNEITVLGDIKLSGHEGPAVVITVHQDLIRKDAPEVITVKDTDIKTNPNRNNTVALVAMAAPGVTQGPEQELHFRGARPQNFATFIDGVKIPGGDIPRVPSTAINNLTVYTGGIPASYGDVTGGVVIIETKGYFDFYRQSQRRKRDEEPEGFMEEDVEETELEEKENSTID